MTNAQPGWYPDPAGDTGKLRYWDGTQWTDHLAEPYDAPASSGPAYASGTVEAPYAPAEEDRTLRLVAFVFAVLCTVSVCWAIIPLAWMIPMTVRCWGIYKGTKPNTTAFGVCTLIFLSLVGGILLLVSKKDQ